MLVQPRIGSQAATYECISVLEQRVLLVNMSAYVISFVPEQILVQPRIVSQAAIYECISVLGQRVLLVNIRHLFCTRADTGTASHSLAGSHI
jgi:hypothetical protein